MKNLLQAKLVVYIVSVILIGIIFYLILKKFGLIPSGIDRQTTKALDQQSAERQLIINTLNNTELFDPNLYRNHPSRYWLNVIAANDSAGKIEKAWGFLNDGEEAIYNVFRKLTNQLQVSQLADVYQEKYNKDLLGDLIGRLSKSELQIIYNIIKQKPLG